VTDAPAPPPPAIERPVSYQASYGVVQGTAPRGARRLLVRVDGMVVCEMPLRRRSFRVDVALPPREVRVRVETVDARGRRSGRTVGHVLGLPPAARPVERSLRLDPDLERDVTRLSAAFPGSAAVYVQDLATGAGAAWNARATFPAASTLKAAIAVTLLGHVDGPPAPGSELDELLWRMLIPSDNEAANTLLVRLGGSTSGGGALVDAELRTIGLERTEMYGGYIIGTAYGVAERDLAARGDVPLTVVSQPRWGVGKATTALDLARLYRAIWLASGGVGPLVRNGSGVSPAEARYLLYLLARVGDHGKLAGTFGESGLLVMHKAGWIDDARHDAGLIVWRGGIFVAATMTYRSSDAGPASDAFAGRVAATALRHVRG
jgi:Beta-lactamase enzyme family